MSTGAIAVPSHKTLNRPGDFGGLDAVIEQLQATDAKLVERTQRLFEQIGVPRATVGKEHERLSRIADSDDAKNVMQDFEVVTKARRK